jgi:hypothetical protein
MYITLLQQIRVWRYAFYVRRYRSLTITRSIMHTCVSHCNSKPAQVWANLAWTARVSRSLTLAWCRSIYTGTKALTITPWPWCLQPGASWWTTTSLSLPRLKVDLPSWRGEMLHNYNTQILNNTPTYYKCSDMWPYLLSMYIWRRIMWLCGVFLLHTAYMPSICSDLLQWSHKFCPNYTMFGVLPLHPQTSILSGVRSWVIYVIPLCYTEYLHP